jgi:hypothetical protein
VVFAASRLRYSLLVVCKRHVPLQVCPQGLTCGIPCGIRLVPSAPSLPLLPPPLLYAHRHALDPLSSSLAMSLCSSSTRCCYCCSCCALCSPCCRVHILNWPEELSELDIALPGLRLDEVHVEGVLVETCKEPLCRRQPRGGDVVIYADADSGTVELKLSDSIRDAWDTILLLPLLLSNTASPPPPIQTRTTPPTSETTHEL